MAIEWIQHPSAGGCEANPGALDFRIDANATRRVPALRFLSKKEVEIERNKLETPADWRTFIMGSFSRRIDPQLGRIPDMDIMFIEGLHQRFAEWGIVPYSSFRRESYGALGIRNNHATMLDRLAIQVSNFLTVLPDSSLSEGTWVELIYGSALGKSFLFTFRESDREIKFKQRIKDFLAESQSHSGIVFVTFSSFDDLFGQIEQVLPSLR